MPVSAETPTEMRRLTVVERDHSPAQEEPAAPPRLGPLLAVCGLTGGAGVTTLAYLIVLAAARQEGGPVLVADTGGPSGGLAALTGVETPHSLPELAAQMAAGGPLRGGVYATGPGGARVVASGPEFTGPRAHERFAELLDDAREAHRLSVIDCGTLSRDADRVALAAATHIAWVLPATLDGIGRGQRVLDAAPWTEARELLVGRRDVGQAKAPLRELRRIAAERHAPLVLVPHLPGLESRRLDGAVKTAQVAIQAILGALTR
jgi:hypothetical protein